MTNNLAKIAKDLRAFAKRCKNVHYSDSLLISFILSGILSLASISFSDTFDNLSDSQKEAAMDSINEMRQQINYARKDNDKLIKGSSLELVKLMEQGDQVVKSPWGSQQFGFGYTYNSWGTSFKGRGGKQNDIKYRRTNDLTKYVYDPNLHEYGATNLHIQRNKEPDALTINPANVHEPYRPYTPERLNDVNVPNAPTFNPTVYSPRTIDKTLNYTGPTGPTAIAARTFSPQGSDKTFWNHNATFNNETTKNYRSYDGWNGDTRNTLKHTLTGNSIGGTATSEGVMYIDNFTTTDSTTYNTVTGNGYWWNPTSTWKSKVQYYNLSSPSASNPYFTPGTIDQGIDGIYDNTYNWNYSYYPWWNSNWYNNAWSNYKANAQNYYADSAHHSETVGNTGKSYDTLYNTATQDLTVGSSTHGKWRTNGSGYIYNSQADAASNEIKNVVDTFYSSSSGWSSWATAHNNYHSGSSLDSDRDTLIYNDGNTLTIENLNAYIAPSITDGNDSFATLKKGKYEVDNVEVDLKSEGNAAYVIDTNGGTTTEISFGTSGGNEMNRIHAKQNTGKHIAFNFQSGVVGVDTTVSVTGSAPVEFVGNNNSVYKVNNYIKELNIINGDNASALGNDNLQTYAPNISTGKGRIWINGSDNVVYDGLGYVKGGKLYLSDVQMIGDRNVIVALQKPTTVVSNGAEVGATGAEIKIQGAIGGNTPSNGNIGIYAASGQGSGISEAHINPNLSGTLSAVDVKEFKVAVGDKATNTTLIFAENGTHVNVESSGNISDGGVWKTTPQRGYTAVKYPEVSTGTIMGYAGGDLKLTDSNGVQVYSNSALTASNPGNSKINFQKPVDLVSKEGIAYYATDGGEITALATRAGGSNSIIAYANGRGKNNSTIKITGDVVAADNLILGSDYANRSAAEIEKSYENIGGYAINGGRIEITGTAAETKAVEDPSSVKSLIYGLGAYATGTDSKVTMEKVTIVDGTKGALLATDNGQVIFKDSNIVNQNNNDLSGSISTNGTGATVTGTRKAKKNINISDHDNVTPFYAFRSTNNPDASIKFDGSNKIDMYDGILLTGNVYSGKNIVSGDSNYREWDYANSSWENGTDADKREVYKNAKYKNMDKVTVNISNNGVKLGIINQAPEEISWTTTKNGTTGTPTGVATGGTFLDGIGEYAGGLKISNSGNYRYDVSLINSKLRVAQDIDLENTKDTRNPSVANDPFNDIKMESTKVTLAANVKGDVRETNRITKGADGKTNYQLENVGLSMANTLFRWNDVYSKNNDTWRKTKNSESGFWVEANKNIEITGGSKDTPVTALNVSYGTIDNSGKVSVDHGNGLVGTDNSILNVTKTGKIIVTGKYSNPGGLSSNSKNFSSPSETTSSGSNYGIVGISRKDTNYEDSYKIDNKNVDTDALEINSQGIIKVDGGESVNGAVTATGIYAQNVKAKHDKVTITYDDTQTATPPTAGIEVQTGSSPTSSRGVGIALVNKDPNGDGGIIKLTGFDGKLGSGAASDNNIVTRENGIGIYAENADIKLASDKFTITTKDDGIGIWVTDNSKVAEGSNHTKTLQYNYDGKDNKNAFAIAFGGRNTGMTTSVNDLDIKFSNHGQNPVDLAYEQAKSKATTAASGGTYKGIAGILVNTNDAGDVVINNGNIEEDKSSVTNIRAYGAVVNKGTFVNYGDIKLNDSLMPNQASDVTSADMKKVNVGIFANRENGLATTIENHGDITIGKDANSDKNIGSWAIYGYNIKTGAKPDGTDSVITINRNSYGIYSGDGNVDIQKTKLKVGNDKVLGHVMHTWTDDAGTVHNIDRQNGNYAQSKDLLSGLDKPRKLDNAIGIYIDKGASNTPRKLNLSADMDIDRFSYGIVLAEKNGGAQTDVTIGTPTDAPTIRLAYSTNNNLGGHVKSTAPTKVPKVIADEVLEQGNSVYYYSADNNSRATSYANVTMDGDYNTAYRTAGSIDNYGTIDLRSQWDIANPTVDKTTGETINLGYGNLGIVSENPDIASTNYGKIITGMSDTQNMRYSAAMAAGRNVYDSNNTFVKTEADGYVINKGNIVVQAKDGIGMFATGSRSRAINYGNIELIGDNSTGMYLDRGAIGENYGTIEGSANNLRGVVAINGGYIKNYGTINVTGQNSNGIVTDSSRFIVDANGNPVKILSPTDAQYTSSQATTAGQNNGKDGSKDLYGGKENSIAEYTSGNPKTTGVGTTIAMPSVVPMTTITVDGVNTPIFTVDTDAATQGQWGEKISITSSIQTGGTRIIDLSQLDGWGNKMWNNYHTDQLSEVTSIGMYVDTSGVKYSNPINGIQNLKNLGEVNLYFGSEATLYTNAKAIRLGTNILKPFNDSLTNLPGGAVVNPLSASLTWQVAAKLDDKNQLTDVYMSKVPYHSFAYDDDTSLVNFTNNLDNVYEIVDFHTNEKEIFNKLNSLGNGEGHILAQAFDQMRAHIYGGIQQRTVATEKIFDSQVSGVMSSNGMVGNPSKDSTKYKAFGERGEYKTDTKGIPDYENYAGGFVAVHEGESIYKGEKHGWYTGVVDNNFSFKDIARSHENQAMIKGGLFKTTPFDVNGEFTWTIAGEGYFGRTDTNRRFWVVDKSYDAESHYYTYGVALKNELAKSFRLSEGFAIKPHVGIDLEYGRYSSFHEDGTMSLDVKGNDYHSIKPNLGVDFTYKQPVFKKSMFVASLGLGYEKELGRVNDVTNEARIQGAWTDYFSIRGDKENKKGNYKADLNLGIDNGRLGFTVNAGYDSTGKNFRGGAGLRFIF